MAHSSHRRRRGCVLCKPHQWKGQGKARKAPWSAIKQVGSKRRWNESLKNSFDVREPIS